MPHRRPRHIVDLMLKRLKLWPVLALLGPRQVGKSTLLRDQLTPAISAKYVTLDDKVLRQRANKTPGSFVLDMPGKHLIIDEVQKAPDLFDAIKAVVDPKKIPGRYILSGSTEFSQKTGIRESLTGRIGLFRLYPMTFAETLEQTLRTPWVQTKPQLIKTSMLALMKRIATGGMPGICFLRNAEEQTAAWDAWLDTTCYRDLQQIRGRNLSGDLALEILNALVQGDEPTIPNIAAILKVDARRIKTHIEALEALFVLNRLNAHRSGVGKAHYYLCDSGLAKHLGAKDSLQFKTWMLDECLAQYESSGIKPKLSYYKSSNRSVVDLLIEDKQGMRAYVISDEEAPHAYVFRTAQAFIKKNPQAQAVIYAPVSEVYIESKNLQIVPWLAMA